VLDRQLLASKLVSQLFASSRKTGGTGLQCGHAQNSTTAAVGRRNNTLADSTSRVVVCGQE
jgi:hypothetical protein